MRQVDFSEVAMLQLWDTIHELENKTGMDWSFEFTKKGVPLAISGDWELQFGLLSPEDVDDGDDYRAWEVIRIPSEFWRPWMYRYRLRDAFFCKFPSAILHSKISSELLERAAKLLEEVYKEELNAYPEKEDSTTDGTNYSM